MDYIDFHTHKRLAEPHILALRDGIDTWGIHPWSMHNAEFIIHNYSSPCESPQYPLPNTHYPIPNTLAQRILCIGECGLDKACDSPYQQQLEAFRHCILLSEEMQLPLILHCVRAVDDCLRLRTELRCRQPWVWHGFRGKPQQLRQLLAKGFYFSFGFHYNQESLVACPADRLLLETDEDPRPIPQLYQQVAQARGLSEAQLLHQVHTVSRQLVPGLFG